MKQNTTKPIRAIRVGEFSIIVLINSHGHRIKLYLSSGKKEKASEKVMFVEQSRIGYVVI